MSEPRPGRMGGHVDVRRRSGVGAILARATILTVALAWAWSGAPGGSAAAWAQGIPDVPDTGWVEVGGDVEADPFADLPAPDADSKREPGGKLRPYLSYNRVDQWIIGLDHSFKPDTGWMPAFLIRVARSAQRPEPDGDGVWMYDMSAEQPLWKDRAIVATGAVYRRTGTDDFGQVGDVENVLSALFYRWDYRDWYDLEGWSAGLRAGLGERVRLAGRYASDEHTSITQTADGTAPFFRQNEPWRDNPAVDEGRISSLTFEAEYDSRTNPDLPRRGLWARGLVETAGGSLGGDYGFIRYRGDVRGYFSPSPSHILKARLMAGTAGNDVLPFQRTFAVGGIGTLRAESFRHYRGNQFYLVNADWSWEVLRRSSRNVAVKTGLSVVLWSDLGLAWQADSFNLGDQRPAWDLGLGVGTTDENFRVYVGRDVRAERAALHWTVRIGRSY